MKSYDYYAVVYDCDHFCVECLPEDVTKMDDGVYPIFADEEMDYPPVCCQCGAVHTYMQLLEGGAR